MGIAADEAAYPLTAAEGGGTTLALIHSDLADVSDAEGTREGWELSLNRLAAMLAG